MMSAWAQNQICRTSLIPKIAAALYSLPALPCRRLYTTEHPQVSIVQPKPSSEHRIIGLTH